jgi:maleylacetoacetate isomerase/maleylpyruvate isomerase
MSERILYGYYRSSAAYRVRIALNLKGLAYRQQPLDLRAGLQRQDEFRRINPQGLVPVLCDGGQCLSQSLAICEYLDEAYPQTSRLLPLLALQRARVRAWAQLIACDIHPLNNLRVLNYLELQLGVETEARKVWVQHWLRQGFEALEAQLPQQGGYCHEEGGPTLADLCLVPQVFNAERFKLPLGAYPNIRRIVAILQMLPAFAAAHPDKQPDAI